mmetsp:Transcript_103668/g.288807  ORF Transcript_103668/g.288807 Transcript_103668/m.288807 type:complete len:197 (-) Transcript_103668:47-637(-)
MEASLAGTRTLLRKSKLDDKPVPKPGATWKKLTSKTSKKAITPGAKEVLRRARDAAAALEEERVLREETEKEVTAMRRVLKHLPRPAPEVGSGPGYKKGGEMHYGRRWCDMTRALDEGALSSVDMCKEAAVKPFHGRSYSDMSRQVANYQNDVQAPPTFVAPPGGFPRKATDVTRDTEAIVWALRNRYPKEEKGRK